jgi:hypothetical protein
MRLKHFVLSCTIEEKKFPFAVYVREPNPLYKNPFYHQLWWLRTCCGGEIDSPAVEVFKQLKVIADENTVLLADLCVYALAPAPDPDGLELQYLSEGKDDAIFHWCGEPCDDLMELCAAAQAVSRHLFGDPVSGRPIDHLRDNAFYYFCAVMLCYGCGEGDMDGDFPHFQHLTAGRHPDGEPTGEYSDSYHDEAHAVCISLDAYGRYLPVNVYAFLAHFVGYRDEVTRPVITHIREKLLAVAAQETFAVPDVSEAHCKAFLAFCKRLAKLYKRKRGKLAGKQPDIKSGGKKPSGRKPRKKTKAA